MAKRKSKISDILEERSSSRSQRSEASSQKVVGVLIGMTITLSAIGAISAMSVEMCRKMMNSS